MGFYDKYVPGTGGGGFVGEKETDALIEDKTVLNVVKVSKGDDPFNKGRQRYVVKFYADDDPEAATRSKGFAADSVESRDDLFNQMIEYLTENPEEIIPLVLTREGRSIVPELVAPE